MCRMPRKSPSPSSPTSPMNRIGAVLVSSAARNGAGNRQQRHDARGVIGDAGAVEFVGVAPHLDRRSLGKNGIDVSAKSNVRSVGIGPRTNAEDIANLVAMNVGKPQFFEACRQPRAARRFAPGRRGYRSHLDLRVFQTRGMRAEPGKGLMNAAQFGNPSYLLLSRTGSLGLACGRRSYWRTRGHDG